MDIKKLTINEPRRFAVAFVKLATTKNKDVDELMQDAFLERLGDLPIDAVEAAAFELAKESSPYLPDAGRWYRTADRLAWEAVEGAKDMFMLPPDRAIEVSEEEKIIKARAKFLKQWAKIAGKSLPDDHPMLKKPVRVPTYSCEKCRDIYMQPEIDEAGTRDMGYTVTRYKKCSCWEYNKTRLRELAQSQLRQSRKQA